MSKQARKRLERERRTVEAMIKLNCNNRHHTTKGELCSDCNDLLNYAYARLDKCPFAENKPACANCRVHCYKPDKRETIRDVMRYAGPKMMLKHPLLATKHMIDHFTKKPKD